jgi:hypothetical protein
VKLSRNAQTASGIALIIVGLYAVHSAWDGAKRPFWLSLLPG